MSYLQYSSSVPLHRVELKVSNNFSDVCYLGDIHSGDRSYNEELLDAELHYLHKTGTLFIGTGDWAECANKDSPGDSIFSQLDPERQVDHLLLKLEPCVKKGLLLGVVEGNHEYRARKSVGVSVNWLFSKSLGVRNYGIAARNMFTVGNETYCTYAWHGRGGSKKPHTKLARVIEKAESMDGGDAFVMSHVHNWMWEYLERPTFNRKTRRIEMRYKLAAITGGHLQYWDSYGEEHGWSPGKQGGIILRFYADRHEIDVFPLIKLL